MTGGAKSEHFRLFQRQEDGTAPPPATLFPQGAFTVGHTIGDLALLSLDMRSERTVDQVLSPAHWDAVYAWLGSLTGAARCRHLLVMSSIPVVHPGFGLVESCLGALPGSQEIEDDLRDHWCSRRHRNERLRLIHRLFSFGEREGSRVTLLSGDVHVGALGYLHSTRSPADGNAMVINQLTSSGIVHPAPPGLMLFALDHLFKKTEDVDRGITAEMSPFPGTNCCYLGARNWLSLTPDAPPYPESGRLWAEWIVEGERDPLHQGDPPRGVKPGRRCVETLPTRNAPTLEVPAGPYAHRPSKAPTGGTSL